MRSPRLRGVAAVLAALVVPVTMASAATPTITISSVGGQAVSGRKVDKPLSGTVDVQGSASLAGAGGGGGTVSRPLVADAGDSPFVEAGASATLLGAGFGGTEPYTFAWSSASGTLTGADAPTAQLDTTGLAAGTYTVSLTVTDAAGATATDTVKVVVYAATDRVLLDETKTDLMPGASLGNPNLQTFLEFPFAVPDGTRSFDVEVTWTNPVNDYDLHLIDPTGVERDYSGNGATNLILSLETAGGFNPAVGTWTIKLDRYLTATDTVRAVVDARMATDPRPTVDAGGPYRFQTGVAQALDGTVTGGAAPVAAAWDLDADGRFETSGEDVTASLPTGRALVTLKATDAAGLERRETTSVLVADLARLAEDTTPITVIGIADSGINPYHLEFSAETYPDPDVLALTANFTRHPSEYIPGYPADAQALDVTLGQGYFPAQDADVWTPENIHEGTLYWIPGTKIIGAWDAGDAASLQEEVVDGNPDSHPILDDNGHGTGSASVSTGNRYGYCPTCLLVMVESLDETVATQFSWVDITSHSFGYVGGLPLGLVLGPNEPTKVAVERGQTVLFAAGNGIGNAFDVPISTYGSDQTGNDWNITVGAIRRDNQRAIVGDGIPVHISAWGDGNLPSACRTGTVGQCAFGGTSAATPYTAGIFGTVLTQVRDAIGDPSAGQKASVTLPDGSTQGQVVASGVPVPGSVYLADGILTRAELREAVLKTAYPLAGETSVFPVPATAPYNDDTNVLFEGYGAATPEGAKRAVDVLLGRATVPDRSSEDEFFALDAQVRDFLYGSYDRDGDGAEDMAATSAASAALRELSLDARKLASLEGGLAALGAVAGTEVAAAVTAPTGANPITYYLHRTVAAEPTEPTPACDAEKNEQSMDRTDSAGDLEPCFENRVTTVVAAYRPVGIFASSDTLDAALPANSRVTAEIYLAGETPAFVRPTATLVATDREIGTAEGTFMAVVGSGPSGTACATLGEACWTRYSISFLTTRHAFAGEQLTFQVALFGTRSWAFGHEAGHASRVILDPAPLPETGYEYGATITSPADGDVLEGGGTVVVGGVAAFPDEGNDPTGAGDHPTDHRVEISLDDPSFAEAVEATYDPATGEFSAPLRGVGDGRHTVYARARMGTITSTADESAFTVRPASRVEWQVVRKNATPSADGWRDASGLADWSFSFAASDYGKGQVTIVTRLVDSGAEVARTSVRARIG